MKNIPAIAWLILFAGIGLLLYSIGKSINTSLKNKLDDKKAKDDSNPVNNDPNSKNYDPSQPTLSKNQLKAIAQTISDSIHWYGNDLTGVENALNQLTNNADMDALIGVFGSAQETKSGDESTGLNLGQFIDKYYADDVININAMLNKNGITNTL